MALGSTQPLTEMSTRNLPGGKGRPARKANNLIVVVLTIKVNLQTIPAVSLVLQGDNHSQFKA
jgi:hypothetical protein